MRVVGPAVLALSVLAAALPAQEPTKDDLLRAVERKLQAAAETAGPAVACVVVSRSDRYPKLASAPERPGKLGGYDVKEFLKAHPTEGRLAESLDLSRAGAVNTHGYACGVVLDPAGLVLTPYHVVEGATKIFVHLPGHPGSYADVHAADARYDLAVLKLLAPPPNLAALKFADVRVAAADGRRPNVVPGKLVVLVASGYGAGRALDRSLQSLGGVTTVLNYRKKVPAPPAAPGGQPAAAQTDSSSYYNFGPLLLHDAKLGAGVSGAALLDLDGKLVGLTTTAAAAEGENTPSYAFPADANFQRVVGVLLRGEEVDYGYLGVGIPQEGHPMRRPDQIVISSALPNGPAAKARLRDGDVITHINGVEVKAYEELYYHVGAALADNPVRIKVLRRPDEVFTVTLGKFRHEQAVIASVRPEPVFGLRVDYNSLLAQPGGVASLTGVPDGVCVREVAPDSPAAAAFKKLGDQPTRWLITSLNGTAVTTPAEFYKAAKGRTAVKLAVRDPFVAGSDREVTFP